jgi:hypothetical protein
MSDQIHNTTYVIDGTEIDDILTHQIKNVTVAVVVVVIARNLSQALSMATVDVARRLVDVKLPLKWMA